MPSTEPSEESNLGPFSTENVTEAGGVEDNESITAAFRVRQQGEVRIFTGLAQSLEVFREHLPVSVARYHEAYFPQDPTQEDVLAEFSAVGGELPNMDPAQTAALQDALICYDKPHRLFEWEYLGPLIEEVVQLDAKYLPCFPFTDPAFSKQFFCLGLEPLSRIAYAVIAVQQILEALMIFLGKDPQTSFTLDPDYGLVGLLERSAHEAELRFTVTSLQQQLSNGNKHILSYFHSIRCTLIDEDWSDIGSSTDSTLPEIRREFGTLNPTQEMYRLLLRPDYALQAAMINDEAPASMAHWLGDNPREQYYHPRKSLPTVKEGSVKG